jgi:hypothetical protein
MSGSGAKNPMKSWRTTRQRVVLCKRLRNWPVFPVIDVAEPEF